MLPSQSGEPAIQQLRTAELCSTLHWVLTKKLSDLKQVVKIYEHFYKSWAFAKKAGRLQLKLGICKKSWAFAKKVGRLQKKLGVCKKKLAFAKKVGHLQKKLGVCKKKLGVCK